MPRRNNNLSKKQSRATHGRSRGDRMRYLVMVSHGTLAPGLHSVLKMLGNDAPNILSTSLVDGMGADEYVENVKAMLAPATADERLSCLVTSWRIAAHQCHEHAGREGFARPHHCLRRYESAHGYDRMMGLATMDLDSLKQMMLQEARTVCPSSLSRPMTPTTRTTTSRQRIRPNFRDGAGVKRKDPR